MKTILRNTNGTAHCGFTLRKNMKIITLLAFIASLIGGVNLAFLNAEGSFRTESPVYTTIQGITIGIWLIFFTSAGY